MPFGPDSGGVPIYRVGLSCWYFTLYLWCDAKQNTQISLESKTVVMLGLAVMVCRSFPKSNVGVKSLDALIPVRLEATAHLVEQVDSLSTFRGLRGVGGLSLRSI